MMTTAERWIQAGSPDVLVCIKLIKPKKICHKHCFSWVDLVDMFLVDLFVVWPSLVQNLYLTIMLLD